VPNTATAPLTHGSSWGLRLHLLCTFCPGCPVGFAVHRANADNATPCSRSRHRPDLTRRLTRAGQTLIADRNYSPPFRNELAHSGLHVAATRPVECEQPAPDTLFSPLRRSIESTLHFKGQLTSNTRRPHPPSESGSASPQRSWHLTAAIWHKLPHQPNHQTIPTGLRPLSLGIVI